MNLDQPIPEAIWKETIRRHHKDAIFFHETWDPEGYFFVALILRHRPTMQIIQDYIFSTELSASGESERLNDLLGYDIMQMVKLKCSHLSRETGESIRFIGDIPNCIAIWDCPPT
ncbi:hypothetical protein [Spectribacter hydrogenoxidans]|uniref:Uncharacterized protein n=1 Tax=Spectribacter hydrogenoxidans TaxID=3075608 RepID=A0ABU3BXH2_9GAMM|nr:hypothetical protein [Salinisphaera sp. W335]MDT0633950.1 hypothetical protein [Salinisphaera sp. W335]